MLLWLLVTVAGVTAYGQTAVGTWEQVPAFGGTPQKAVATNDCLYYASAGNLGSVDADGGDVRTYATSNLLNASAVSYTHLTLPTNSRV